MLFQDEVSIETIRPEALPDVFRIWDLSFAPPYDIFDPEDYVRNQLALLLAAVHRGKVVAVSGVINFEMQVGSSTIPCAGIAAVATHPSYRRQGLTGKLLHSTLSWLYQERYPLACLWPFSYQFYEHYGWCVTDTQFKVTLDVNAIPKVGSPRGYEEILADVFASDDVRRSILRNDEAKSSTPGVNPKGSMPGTNPKGSLQGAYPKGSQNEANRLLNDDVGRSLSEIVDYFGKNYALPALHDEWCQSWNLSLRRTPQRWRRMFAKPGAAWMVFLHDEGYMLINRSDSKDGTLAVREWCYLSDRAFHDGLALLSQMDSQFQKVSWICGEVDSLLKLGVPHQAAIEYLPGMMTRIVHPKAFEEAIGTKLSDVRIVDPTGISSTNQGEEFDDLDTIGPGQLMQLVTGFFPQAPSANLERLRKVRGARKAFTVEKF